MTPTPPRSEYNARAEAADEAVVEWTSVADRIANRRGLTFIGAMALLILARTVDGVAIGAWAGFAILVVGYLHLVARHARARFEIRWHEAIGKIQRESISRLDRDWAALPTPSVDMPEAHPYADDLDVLGEASLLALVGGASTRPGLRALRSWLLAPAGPDEIRDRQTAVRELTGALDFRERLWARARLSGDVTDEELRRLVEWAEEPGWALERTDLKWASRVLPILTGAAVLVHGFGVVPYLWVPPLMISFWVNRGIQEAIIRDFLRVSMGERGLRRYAEIIEQAAEPDFECTRLRALRDGLTEGEVPPPEALRTLFRLTELGEVRRNFFHPILDLFFHWDIHVVRAAERWKARHGRDLRRWLEALGDLDALAALSGLSHAHPDWSWPEITDPSPTHVHASGIGHPLLPPETCVRNDVSVGPEGTFLLVTGSNMSGKSTLLRAVGLNSVLAGAGAPTCAAAFRAPVLDLRTSMRVRDAVDEGVSYFMAGLQKLKGVVEGARAATPERPVLYLLDEILQGTNTAERQIAARGVIRELLGCHAIGAVTTHDLTLAEVEELARVATRVHFRDAPGTADRPLLFDYVLRPGIATSTNALKLMELMGLTASRTAPTGRDIG